ETDAQVGVLGHTLGDELLGDERDEVARDGEAQADAARRTTGAGGHGRDRAGDADDPAGRVEERAAGVAGVDRGVDLDRVRRDGDRKSTRLNSSHVKISYA